MKQSGRNAIFSIVFVLASSCASERHASISRDQLVSAVMRGDVAAVQSFLDEGGDPNTVVSEFSKNTLLHLAAVCDRVDVARLLIKYGADVSITNAQGDSPLACALENANSAIADVLAVPDVPDEDPAVAICASVIQKDLSGARTLGDIYLAVDGEDPSPALLRSLAGDGIVLRPISSLAPEAAGAVVIAIRIREWKARTSAVVDYRYDARSQLAGHGFRALVAKRYGHWIVSILESYES